MTERKEAIYLFRGAQIKSYQLSIISSGQAWLILPAFSTKSPKRFPKTSESTKTDISTF